jgi:hypothetical protein
MAIPLTAREPVPFRPPSLAATKPDFTAMIRVPTMYERDAYQAALVRGGIVHYSKSSIRELMLAGAIALHGEDKFDTMRADFEDMWAAGDAMTECNQHRIELNIELVEKNEELPEGQKITVEEMQKRMDAIKPDIEIDGARHVRITALQQDVTSRYEPLQKAFADLAEQETRRDWLNIETYVTGWSGLSHTPDGNGRGGITRREAEWLRAQIGSIAFTEISGVIFSMHGLDDDDEKNLASLLENASLQAGSTATEMTTGSDAGNSGDEPSIETLAPVLPATTEPSSKSSKASETKTTKSEPSPTDAG